jgi:hypothetical protein
MARLKALPCAVKPEAEFPVGELEEDGDEPLPLSDGATTEVEVIVPVLLVLFE